MVQNQVASPYDKRALGWGLFGILFFTLVMKFTGEAGFLLVLPLILIGFGKNRTVLLTWCILLTTVLTMTNPFFAPKGMIFSTTAKVVYLLVGGIMTLQVIGLKKSKVTTPLLSLLMYIAYMYLVSQQGWMPLISTLKLTLFLITFLAFYSVGTAAATRISMRPEALRSVFLSFACFLIFGSIALIPFPSISLMRVEAFFLQYGYYPEGSLFMGMMNHSQALGPIAVFCAIFLLADWLFSVKKWSKLYTILFICTPILVYKTGSRTAMGTFLAGALFVFFFFMRARGMGARWKERVLVLGFFLGLCGALCLFATPQMRESVTHFIFKTHGEGIEKHEQTFERLTSTRQGLVDAMKENIADSPAIGNGFQVSKEMQYLEVTNFAQVLSAPVEKGVWIYAVMEEGGYFGMAIFLLFLLISFTLLLSCKAYIGASLLFILTISNLGEFTFFSMSGSGGIYWIFIFIGLALDAQTIHRRQRERMMQAPQMR